MGKKDRFHETLLPHDGNYAVFSKATTFLNIHEQVPVIDFPKTKCFCYIC